MMDAARKDESPPRNTNRLPSISTLFQTSSGNELPPSRHHSPESSLTIPYTTTHSPQLSISNPPSSLGHQHTTSYSYNRPHHSRDESYPLQFRFPEPGIISREGSSTNILRDNQPTLLPSHRKTQSFQLSSKRTLVELPSEISQSVVQLVRPLQDIETFSRSFNAQYATLQNSHGNVPITSVSTEQFDKLMNLYSLRDLDNILSSCEEIKNSISKIKQHSLDTSSQPEITPPQEGSSNKSETRVNPTSISSPPKRRKKSTHEKSSSMVGELIPMRINLQLSPTGGHQEPIDQGGLNSELSIREKTITCKHCGSENTPEWRSGPDGSRTLCNACGLFYSKLIRKYGLLDAVKIMEERKVSDPTDRRIL
ncbi:uncharacterized protein RJT21DRAFT_132060 [Scheffersomyces amazonensis]|uniref:uncharacterized protein n=1 Tax=Scheffersomyces amazonensis TaxID=1078765 RepID=UPI00315C7508